MRDKCIFFVGITNLLISPNAHDSLICGNDFTILSNKKKERIIGKPELTNLIGGLEVRFLREAPYIAFRELEYNDLTNDKAEKLAFELSTRIRSYFDHLWSIRDCCILLDQGYLINLTKNSIHANRDMVSSLLADGTIKTIRFSREEVKRVSGFFKYINVDHPSVDDVINSQSPGWFRRDDTSSGRSSNRVTRAVSFVGSARASSDLGIKIAHYCSALEALLLSDSAELRYRVAERVALLVPKGEQLNTFKAVKKLYDIRSQILHGVKVSKNVDLKSQSISADNIVRSIISQVLHEGSELQKAIFDEKVEDYFLEKLFD